MTSTPAGMGPPVGEGDEEEEEEEQVVPRRKRGSKSVVPSPTVDGSRSSARARSKSPASR